MKITIEINQYQLDEMRELLGNKSISNEKLIQEFIIENTCIDENGDEF